jgi:hypothetical protein
MDRREMLVATVASLILLASVLASAYLESFDLPSGAPEAPLPTQPALKNQAP